MAAAEGVPNGRRRPLMDNNNDDECDDDNDDDDGRILLFNTWLSQATSWDFLGEWDVIVGKEKCKMQCRGPIVH